MNREGLRSGRLALIEAAERLIAEEGPAVSLRQVVSAAGQRNSSAIRYHFGTRAELIGAVVDARQSVFEPKRLRHLAELEAAGEVTARGLIRALLEPVFEHQRGAQPSHHARFMEKIRDHAGVELVRRQDWAATRLIASQLARCSTPVPESQRATRTRGLISVVFALLADLERAEHRTLEEREAAEQATIDMVLGVVRFDPSAELGRTAVPDLRMDRASV
ncbi:MAG: TetR family transcriptional regulator [Myxococcota bacterium]